MKLRGYMQLGFVLICLATSFCRGVEAELTLDAVLEKWEKASQECRILDTKLKYYHYDRFLSVDKPEIAYGRFYHEMPHVGRLDKSEWPTFETNRWSELREAMIWNGKESICINPSDRFCQKVKIEDLPKLPNEPPKGIFARLQYAIAMPFYGPKVLMPLLVDVRAAEVREHYELAVERVNGDIMITAIPKKNATAGLLYSKIRILLDSKSFQTKAVQYIQHGRQYYTSIVLYDRKINEKPNDREQLLEPDLSEFKIMAVSELK